MKLNQNELTRSIQFALVMGASAVLALPAVAQEEGDEEEMDAVQVLGSRIKRTDRETSQPVLVLTRETIEKSGFTSVGDVLQRLPEIGPSINTLFNNGGDGSTTVDLRNLGASRTLVLMNGRRWVPGIGGTVDLNTIPTAVIESIEVLKDGASAIYGSDAIAGVINITTRKDFDGARASAFIGESSEGDGRRYASDFTMGVNGERGNVTMSASFTKEEEIRGGDRAISAVPNFPLSAAATGSSTTPQGRYGVAGLAGTFTNSSPQAGAQNTRGQFRAYDPNTDAYNFAPDNYLQTPQERSSIFALGRYDIFDNVSFNAHMLFNNRKSSQELAFMPVVLGPGFAAGLGGTVTVAANNPFNPFGAAVTRIQRRFNEAGPRRFVQDVNTFRFGAGFSGALEFGDRFFDWETGYSYTNNKQNQATFGLFNLARIRNGLSAIDNPATTAFDPTCVTPGATTVTAATTVAGCVPLNILGGQGAITPAMLNYISFTAQDALQTETQNYFANLSGALFTLPAGDVGFSVGYEYRKEAGFDLPDAIIAAGETTGNSRLATGGSFALDELYAETIIPILSDVQFAQMLEAKVAVRYSDYDTFGDTTNWAAGFQWKPINDLKIRGNYNEGFRAPNVLELFRGRSDSFPGLADPCSPSPGSIAQQLPTTVANCRSGLANLPPVPTTYIQPNAQIRITIGGEPTLTPETSQNYTLGFVYSPEYVEGLETTLDWWRIKIENVIGGRGAATLLTQCYRDRNVQACGRITRAADGNITDILSTGENIGFSEIEGIDWSIGYKFPEFDFGNFRVRLDTTYFIKEESQNLAFNPTLPFQYHRNNPINSTVGLGFDRGGTTNRIKAQFNLDWELGSWSATWRARYTSGTVESCNSLYIALSPGFCTQETLRDAAGGALPRTETGSVTYHDFSAAYVTPWDSTLRVGINNAFDKDPPISTVQFANSFDPQFDVPGSFYYMQYTHNF